MAPARSEAPHTEIDALVQDVLKIHAERHAVAQKKREAARAEQDAADRKTEAERKVAQLAEWQEREKREAEERAAEKAKNLAWAKANERRNKLLDTRDARK
jgi:hypothetical protein